MIAMIGQGSDEVPHGNSPDVLLRFGYLYPKSQITEYVVIVVNTVSPGAGSPSAICCDFKPVLAWMMWLGRDTRTFGFLPEKPNPGERQKKTAWRRLLFSLAGSNRLVKEADSTLIYQV